MEKLLDQFAAAPSIDKARKVALRVVAYDRKHPFAELCLSPEYRPVLSVAREYAQEAK